MTLGNNIPTWNAALILMAGLVVGTFVWDAVTPRPTQKNRSAIVRDRNLANQALAKAEADLKAVQTERETLAWAGKADSVAPLVVQRVMNLAREQKVEVQSVRPQKVASEEDLTRLTFVVAFRAPAPRALQFARSLEASGTRLGVYMMQMANADGRTELVNASLGVVAYARNPEPPKPAASASPRSSARTSGGTARGR
jgi:hypothetical protein